MRSEKEKETISNIKFEYDVNEWMKGDQCILVAWREKKCVTFNELEGISKRYEVGNVFGLFSLWIYLQFENMLMLFLVFLTLFTWKTKKENTKNEWKEGE